MGLEAPCVHRCEISYTLLLAQATCRWRASRTLGASSRSHVCFLLHFNLITPSYSFRPHAVGEPLVRLEPPRVHTCARVTGGLSAVYEKWKESNENKSASSKQKKKQRTDGEDEVKKKKREGCTMGRLRL